ncbi:unnamed protein product [Callosobruchus maculatus]|uniref:IGFBP N-terminal domain-containing protein n=1 Tax=Callosobruchus maculatus TaxID=64391 RepID=A0A653BRI9_CALMS|nr:unnamed protein product [Callosobruchus maculatus]
MRLLLAIGLFALAIVQCTSETCPSDYCEGKVFHCPLVKCSGEDIVRIVPERCNCCRWCYKRLSEGATCGNDVEGLCDDDLKCIDSICKRV